MAEVRLTVLGPLTVTVDGRQVPIPGRRERAVLATLLAARGEPVPAERLLEEVWGTAAAGINSLHVAMSRLRSLLEPDRPARSPSRLLETSVRGYALVLASEAVDAARFADLVRAAGRELEADRPHRAATLAEEADALWTGPPFAEVPGGDLIAAEVARLEELRLSAAEVLAEARLALGRADEVVAALEPLRSANPFRERLWQLSARALYQCDRQGEALATLRQLRRLLADELGIDPAPATQQLEAAILQQDPVLVPASEPATAGRRAAESGPKTLAGTSPLRQSAGRASLVGRDAEFAQLRGLLAEAAGGRTRFALVEGEPGIGKTRLLEEAADYATDLGMRAVWGRCAEAEMAPAYWPWLQVVRRIASGKHAAELPADVAALVDPAAGRTDLTQERRFAVFEGIVAMLEAVCAEAPLLLLLEDVHWADAASAELLAHLAARLHDDPIAIVASRREPELGREDAVAGAMAAVSRRAGTRRLVLRGVIPAAAPPLVASVLQHEVRPEVARAVHRRAEGNPFFIAELSRLLESQQGLADPAAVDRAGIPAGVRDVVRQRLAGLPTATREVLEVVAVLGRESDLPLVVAASGLPQDACIDALEPALRARVLVPVPDAPGRYRFGHALVREVALAEVSALRAGRLHARVADALLNTGNKEDAEAAAGHLWAAAGVVDPVRAAEALEDAAARALRRTAYESADDLLERALALWQTARVRDAAADEAELAATLRLAQLRRARQGYGPATASVPLDRADELARRTGRLDLLIGLLHMRWGALTTSCEVPAAVAAAREMRHLADTSPDPLVQLIGRAAWGVQCWQVGRLREAADAMQQVLDLQSALGPRDRTRLSDYGATLTAPWAVFVLELAGRIDDGEQRLEQLAASFPDPYARVVVANFGGLAGFCTGDAARAARWAARGLADDHGRGFSFVAAACRVTAGWATAVTTDPVGGLATLEAGLAQFRATGARTVLGLLIPMYVEALLAAGRPVGQAREVLERGAVEVTASGEEICLPYLQLARARIAEAEGGDAATYVRRAEEQAARLGLAVAAGRSDRSQQ